ncbi:MAG: hypothetical protein JKY96_09500 [Phycisphaerales bacterium]|nr:hypothetical protein [Phycisphaerales bacterium]
MMKGDYLTYRRGSSVSLLGLILQIVLTIAMLLYAIYSHDSVGVYATIFLGTGIIIWAVQLLVFDQHRRERIEALEADQLAASGAVSASAFEGVSDDLRVAARRLIFIQKWIVPASAVLVAGINLFFGLSGAQRWVGDSSSTDFNSSKLAGFGLAIGVAMGVIGFIFARFTSGMGKEKAWGMLRSGAAQSVAGSLIGVLIAVGAFFQLALDKGSFTGWAPLIIAIAMIVLGAEIVMNLVLDMYRPRKPGEDPRPAFDSRLLGLLAAPDRIAENAREALSCQFGVDVTSTWFYRLVTRWAFLLVAAGVFIGWLMTSLVVVQPHERGLILTNGRISQPLMSFGESASDDSGDIGPGLHVKWPWPIASYETPVLVSQNRRTGDIVEDQTTTGVRILDLASDRADNKSTPIVWTETHSAREMLNIVHGDRSDSSDSADVAGLSLLAVEVPMQYVVQNVELFDRFASPADREELLKVIGRRVVTQYLGELQMHQVLASYRTTMPEELMKRLNAAYSKLNNGQGPGIKIVFVGVHGVHPPKKVAPNFLRVIQAQQNQASSIEDAEKARIKILTEIVGTVKLADDIVDALNELDVVRGAGGSDTEIVDAELKVQRLLEQAGGEAGESLLVASSQRWQRHMSERGRAALLQGQLDAYLAAPELFRSKMYFDAWLDSTKYARVYLVPKGLEDLKIRIELQDREAGTKIFDTEAGKEFN